VDVLPDRGETLRQYDDEGYRLVALSWRPEIAEGVATREQVDAVYARMQELLGVTMDVLYCPHAAGPPTCWCRKPLPGLGVLAIVRHHLDASRCVYVGAGGLDAAFAQRLGFGYREAARFFAKAP